jgi:NAD(P)-dependent dehydrogenase (short-subunit alcohol dehydrogenase family)
VASKGAVFALTRALARELSGIGIHVNTITPGYTRTEAAQGLADPETVARIQEWVLDHLNSLLCKAMGRTTLQS